MPPPPCKEKAADHQSLHPAEHEMLRRFAGQASRVGYADAGVGMTRAPSLDRAPSHARTARPRTVHAKRLRAGVSGIRAGGHIIKDVGGEKKNIL